MANSVERQRNSETLYFCILSGDYSSSLVCDIPLNILKRFKKPRVGWSEVYVVVQDSEEAVIEASEILSKGGCGEFNCFDGEYRRQGFNPISVQVIRTVMPKNPSYRDLMRRRLVNVDSVFGENDPIIYSPGDEYSPMAIGEMKSPQKTAEQPRRIGGAGGRMSFKGGGLK